MFGRGWIGQRAASAGASAGDLGTGWGRGIWGGGRQRTAETARREKGAGEGAARRWRGHGAGCGYDGAGKLIYGRGERERGEEE